MPGIASGMQKISCDFTISESNYIQSTYYVLKA